MRGGLSTHGCPLAPTGTHLPPQTVTRPPLTLGAPQFTHNTQGNTQLPPRQASPPLPAPVGTPPRHPPSSQAKTPAWGAPQHPWVLSRHAQGNVQLPPSTYRCPPSTHGCPCSPAPRACPGRCAARPRGRPASSPSAVSQTPSPGDRDKDRVSPGLGGTGDTEHEGRDIRVGGEGQRRMGTLSGGHKVTGWHRDNPEGQGDSATRTRGQPQGTGVRTIGGTWGQP